MKHAIFKVNALKGIQILVQMAVIRTDPDIQ